MVKKALETLAEFSAFRRPAYYFAITRQLFNVFFLRRVVQLQLFPLKIMFLFAMLRKVLKKTGLSINETEKFLYCMMASKKTEPDCHWLKTDYDYDIDTMAAG